MRYDAGGAVVGITLVGVRAILERGKLVVTVPQIVDVRRDEIAVAVA